MPPIRVLVVDDSAYMRHVVSRELASDPAIQVVGAARDGLEALELVARLGPDVVTLDVEMPRLGGLETLERLMRERPTPVVMLSSLTQAGAATTLRALELGAVDAVGKPGSGPFPDLTAVRAALLRAVKTAAAVDPRRLARRAGTAPTPQPPAARRSTGPLRVLLIGSSTGGPRALYELVPQLPGDRPLAVVIVQHLPAGFTQALAERLNERAALHVKEAALGDRLEPGLALVAPGGRHLLIRRTGEVALSDDPPVHGVRPAVDVTLHSLVEGFGPVTTAVILTGMGADGANGCVALKAAGGRVIAEDESSCVVYGMPRAVVERGAADLVLPLARIAPTLARLLE